MCSQGPLTASWSSLEGVLLLFQEAVGQTAYRCMLMERIFFATSAIHLTTLSLFLNYISCILYVETQQTATIRTVTSGRQMLFEGSTVRHKHKTFQSAAPRRALQVLWQ